MQTAINPALAAAMTLEQAAQMGEFSPVTKDGTPTVVGGKLQQMMQPMMQPSMPGVQNTAQRAGLGGQIQAMQMQEAQKAMMNAAMQQARPPAGIERLNPQMGNFAEGGIVGTVPGYARGEVAEDEPWYKRVMKKRPEDEGALEKRGYERLLDTLAQLAPAQSKLGQVLQARRAESETASEASRFANDVPYGSVNAPVQLPAVAEPPSREREMFPPAPTQEPAATSQGIAAALGERARAEAASMQGPATPEQVLAREQRNRAVYDQYLRSQGIDPDAFTKREQEDKDLIAQQRALLRERMEREEGRDTFISRLGAAARGFKQMKGQGTGDALAGAYDNLARQVQAGEMRMDQFKEFELKLNELEITRRRAIDDARRATAEGRWKDAQQALATETAAANEIKKIQIATYMPQAQAQIEEAKVGEMARQRGQVAQSQEFARLQGIASTYEARKVEALRKLDEDFAKNNKLLLQQEQVMKDKMPASQQQALDQARDAHRMNRASVAKQFDDRLAMINQRLYPGVDFSVGTPSSSPNIQAARNIVARS